MVKKFLIILFLIFISNYASFSEDSSNSKLMTILSLNLGRFFPYSNTDFTYNIDDQYFDSKMDFKDDMSFGANLKFIVKNRFLLETGGDFFFGEANLATDLVNNDIAGGFDADMDFRKSTVYMNLGIIPYSWEKIVPYLSIGPTWSYVKSGEGTINANFYVRDQNVDKIKKVLLTVEAAKMQKKYEEMNIGGLSDDAFGYNITTGVTYFFDKRLYMDLGMRYTSDKVKLWESETFDTGDFNVFIGVGFSLIEK
jgi:hypothetical protein